MKFDRPQLAIIQTALNVLIFYGRRGSSAPPSSEVEKAKTLMHEIQSYLLNDLPASPLTPEFLARLRNTKSGKEWSEVCKGVVPNSNGDYPHDWFAKVMESGLQAEVYKNWEKEIGPLQCAGCNHYRVTVDEDTGFCRECTR